MIGSVLHIPRKGEGRGRQKESKQEGGQALRGLRVFLVGLMAADQEATKQNGRLQLRCRS